jgi:hypothetical protein
MCKVYNQIGSLKTIQVHLRNNNVSDFNSIKDIIYFQKNYTSAQQQIISNQTTLIEQEKNILKQEIPQLERLVESNKSEATQLLNLELQDLKQKSENLLSAKSNIINGLFDFIKRRKLNKKIQNLENKFDVIIANSIVDSTNTLDTKTSRYNFIVSHFSEAVQRSANLELKELERKKRIIDQINPSIYGAIGENKVAKELENLPDDYVLINDFSYSFRPPIYNRKENDYIKSIQIDHILIAPSGIFLIETKNWSEHSMNNLNLRSPVEQINRTNFALYYLLHKEISRYLPQHHWGNKRIPIRNLIVIINQKPNEEFQFVKILTLKELVNYVKYFNPIFSVNETETIANYLLRFNA